MKRIILSSLLALFALASCAPDADACGRRERRRDRCHSKCSNTAPVVVVVKCPTCPTPLPPPTVTPKTTPPPAIVK